jgi:hypothetical protein
MIQFINNMIINNQIEYKIWYHNHNIEIKDLKEQLLIEDLLLFKKVIKISKKMISLINDYNLNN